MVSVLRTRHEGAGSPRFVGDGALGFVQGVPRPSGEGALFERGVSRLR